MKQRDDSVYFEKRIAEERRRAEIASNPSTARVHLNMVAEYESRLRENTMRTMLQK